MIERGLHMIGLWHDVITQKMPDGRLVRRVTEQRHNRICIGMTEFMAWAFVQSPASFMTNLRHGIGLGDGAWSVAPVVAKSDTALINEVAATRRDVDSVSYIKAGTGTATSTDTTATLIDNLRWEPDAFFNGQTINIVGGTNVGQSSVITNWDLATFKFTVATPFSSACDNTSEYEIVPAAVGTTKGSVEIRTTWPFGGGGDPFNGIDIREQGIFFDDAVSLPVSLPSGTMVNKIYHAPIAKTTGIQLERIIRFLFDIRND